MAQVDGGDEFQVGDEKAGLWFGVFFVMASRPVS